MKTSIIEFLIRYFLTMTCLLAQCLSSDCVNGVDSSGRVRWRRPVLELTAKLVAMMDRWVLSETIDREEQRRLLWEAPQLQWESIGFAAHISRNVGRERNGVSS